MGRACNMHRREKKCIYDLGVKNRRKGNARKS
jgi:hypothetical protein